MTTITVRQAAAQVVAQYDRDTHTGMVLAIEALRAALAQPEPQGWRPISTAPKDGTMFLCWVSAVRYGETDDGQQYAQDVSQVDFCNWRVQHDIPDCGWFEPCCGQIGDQQAVTHWQPLPDAPKENSNG